MMRCQGKRGPSVYQDKTENKITMWMSRQKRPSVCRDKNEGTM